MSFQLLNTRFNFLLSYLNNNSIDISNFIVLINERINIEILYSNVLVNLGKNNVFNNSNNNSDNKSNTITELSNSLNNLLTMDRYNSNLDINAKLTPKKSSNTQSLSTTTPSKFNDPLHMHSTLNDAVDCFKSDILNNAKVKLTFIESLKLDVLEPITSMYNKYQSILNINAKKGKDIINSLISIQNQFQQTHKLLDISRKESLDAREKLIEAKLAASSYGTLTRLTQLANETMNNELINFERYNIEKNELNKTVNLFHTTMQTVLFELQRIEELKIETLKTAMQRHLVDEISYISNRNYDTANINAIFEDVSVSIDMHSIVQSLLNQPEELPDVVQHIDVLSVYNGPSSPSKGYHSAPSSSRGNHNLKGYSSPASPYMSKRRQNIFSNPVSSVKKPKSDLVSEMSSWMDGNVPIRPVQKNYIHSGNQLKMDEEMEDMEELYLGDLIGRLTIHHDLSSQEMKKLNSTLSSLKHNAPFALLRVLLHYANSENLLEMDIHAYDFFAQLLRNMIKKFIQLKDMVAAFMTCYVARYIVKLDTNDSVHSYLVELNELDPIINYEVHFFDSCDASISPESLLTKQFHLFLDVYNVDINIAIDILKLLSLNYKTVLTEDRLNVWIKLIQNTVANKLSPPASNYSTKSY